MKQPLALVAFLALTLMISACASRPSTSAPADPPANGSAGLVEGGESPSAEPSPPASGAAGEAHTDGPSPSADREQGPADQPRDPVQAAIGPAAEAVLTALSDGDLAALASFVHPVHGVRFSPYGFVVTDEEAAHQVFSATELAVPGLLDETFQWGVYDGSGEFIILTFQQYLNQFVYNYDYANAPNIGWNTVMMQGNTLLNHDTVYPGSLFVDYHWPGSEEHDGMDWGTLRLVFTEHEGNWYVVGIIHDQWTI